MARIVRPAAVSGDADAVEEARAMLADLRTSERRQLEAQQARLSAELEVREVPAVRTLLGHVRGRLAALSELDAGPQVATPLPDDVVRIGDVKRR